VKLQYINGHFCYAQKAAVVANGLGIVRHLELFDDGFKAAHPEMQIEKRTNHPEIDKEIGDSTSLKPVLLDFKAAHPCAHYSVFSADAAFDSYENFSFLPNDYGFQKAVVPLNPRRGLPATDVGFNENGTPLCPLDALPLKPHGHANEKHRSPRLKFICPKSKLVLLPSGKRSFRCQCETPCSSSKYGRCVYLPLNKNLRLYPGISRDDPAFAQIYTRRTCVERSINSLKDTLGISNRKTSHVLTVTPRPGIVGAVRRQLEREKITGKTIFLCFTRDPYPADIDTTPTREVIQAIKDSGNSVRILTKGGDRARRDFDLLGPSDWFGVTITESNELFLPSKMEPKAAPFAERLATLERAKQSGVSTWVSLEPVFDPKTVYSLIRSAEYIDLFKIGKLNYAATPPEIIKAGGWAAFGREAERLCREHGRA